MIRLLEIGCGGRGLMPHRSRFLTRQVSSNPMLWAKPNISHLETMRLMKYGQIHLIYSAKTSPTGIPFTFGLATGQHRGTGFVHWKP